MPSSIEKMLGPEDLRHHQQWMSQAVLDIPYLMLCSYMGSGKTVSVLTAARKLLDRFEVRKILIVAPLLVAEDTWPEEIAKWRHTRVLQYEVVTGSESRRISRLEQDAEIYIINRENVPWLWEYYKGREWPFDWLVWDESSRLKAGRKRTKGGKKVREDGTVAKPKMSEFGAICAARKYLTRVTELTGTPAPNGVEDLWGQVYLLDQGQRLGATKRDFEHRWFHKDASGYGLVPHHFSEKEIMGRIKDVMLCLREQDYADLPECVINVVKAPLSDKAMKEYRRFKRTLVTEEYDVEAVTRGVLTNKLLQFANGSLYHENGDDIHVHDEKIKALERIIEEAAGQPVLIAYSFKFDLRRILKKFPKAEVLRKGDPDVIKRWNRGEVPLLLTHPASAGHGLNLQFGGNIAVWYGLNWSLELYQQFNKRLHRDGQKKTVFLHHIIAPGTVDEAVMAAMQSKGATQDSVTEAVRVLLKSA